MGMQVNGFKNDFENREELFARIAFDRDNAKSIAESWIESCGAETAALLGI